ncbi:pilus assembly protein PilM [Clostridium ganghwense]|uniref:Pilus assembly protein PilM n=1 Tax=Clostridium ganghwense TaxID=312089 RepID=A0ABT4CPC4_9CLOT|nr:pilus assembly protein PilM [Clostridium ganghwense]MCY6370912.1 pilus assembly protein PilM [Clostridium ganghwense]
MFQRNVLSLELGSENAKLVEGRMQGKKVIVQKALSFEVPKNCFNDGEITNLITMKEELAEAIKRMNTKTKKLICVSKSTSIITREISVPLVKPNEMDSLIEYEMKQYLPINFDEYIIKYKKLNEYEEESVKKAAIRVGIYPKIMAKMYWDLAKELKFTPVALDLSSNCIAKLFDIDDIDINSEQYSLENTVVVVDIGYEQIELNIISEGVLQFTRIIMGGGSYLDANIASELGISDKEAEKKKMALCNLKEGKILENEEAEIITASVKRVVDRWASDIQRMIDYYINKNRFKKMSKIYIHGGVSELKGICGYMESLLNIPVEKLEQMSNISVTGEAACNINLERYLNAIGGIIRLR